MQYDVVIAGGGISGLLLASEMSTHCRLLLIEQKEHIPNHKYWLTNAQAAQTNPQLRHCVDSTYDFMDFLAYDDTKARIQGPYYLWDTNKLITFLTKQILQSNTRILTGHRFYSYRYTKKGLIIRAGRESIPTRLFIDCMGYGSPLITAKGIVRILGYYLLHGKTLAAKTTIDPVGLHNVMVQPHPTYLELFPAKDNLVHAVMIVPARQARHTSLAKDFNFIIKQSHYASMLGLAPPEHKKGLFGIVPVGRLKKRALDRIFFYGEAGQVNPATSATGMTRMLYTYRPVASFLLDRLKENQLDRRSLQPKHIPYMSKMNRLFQEALFEGLLDFRSDDFKKLVEDMARFSDSVVNDLIFADFNFSFHKTLRILLDIVQSPGGLAKYTARSLLRYVMG